MKKIFALLLVLALAAMLFACGGDEPVEPAGSDSATESVSESLSDSETETVPEEETEPDETEPGETEEDPKDIWEDIKDAMETEDAVTDADWSGRY